VTDLPKVPQPAARALSQAGITNLEQLTKVSEKELLELHGMGPNAVERIKAALADRGLALRPQS
jgi:DNA-directed RNA polymerase alpha subunit